MTEEELAELTYLATSFQGVTISFRKETGWTFKNHSNSREFQISIRGEDFDETLQKFLQKVNRAMYLMDNSDVYPGEEDE